MNKKKIFTVGLYGAVAIILVMTTFAVKFAVETLDLRIPGFEVSGVTKKQQTEALGGKSPLVKEDLNLEPEDDLTSSTNDPLPETGVNAMTAEEEKPEDKDEPAKKTFGFSNPDPEEQILLDRLNEDIQKEIEISSENAPESADNEPAAKIEAKKTNDEAVNEADFESLIATEDTKPNKQVKKITSTPAEEKRSKAAQSIDDILENSDSEDTNDMPETPARRGASPDDNLSLDVLNDTESVTATDAGGMAEEEEANKTANSAPELEKPDAAPNATDNPLAERDNLPPAPQIKEQSRNPVLFPEEEIDLTSTAPDKEENLQAQDQIEKNLTEAEDLAEKNKASTEKSESVDDIGNPEDWDDDVTALQKDGDPETQTESDPTDSFDNAPDDNAPATRNAGGAPTLEEAEAEFRKNNPDSNSEGESDTINVTGATGGNLTCAFHRTLDTARNEERVTLTLSGADLETKKFLVVREMNLERYINMKLDKADGYPEEFSALTAFCGKFKVVTTLSEDY